MISLSADPKEIKSNKTFQYGNKIVEYNLIQSKRRKTFEIIVDKYRITIRSPFDKSITEIEQILNDRIKWVFVKQKEIQIQKPEIIKPSYIDRSTLPYLGKNYEIKIIYYENITKERVEFVKDMFIFYILLDRKENKTPVQVKDLYKEWLEFQATNIFKEKIDQYSDIVKVHPKRVILKFLKKRWGSVTKNNTINLNVNLVKAKEDVVDYIIIHELCHFKIQGHSYLFWNFLKQYVPNYKQNIKWLEINSDNLLF